MKFIIVLLLMTGCSLPDIDQKDFRCHEKSCKASQEECDCPPLAKIEVAPNGTILCKCQNDKEPIK